jgi:Ca-activated chloride channel family protein
MNCRTLARLALMAACLVVSSARATGWTDWWQRPDQQAQALLDAGKPAAAAPLFDDPRRRAYAQIQAQQFDAAAKQLQPLTDPESLYNRGNALARAGQLSAAVQNYETALKKAAHDSALYRDASHNRDLVAKQLQQQQQSQQQGGAGQGQDKNKEQDRQDQQGSPGQQGSQAPRSPPGPQAQQSQQAQPVAPSQQSPAQPPADARAAEQAGRQAASPAGTVQRAPSQLAGKDAGTGDRLPQSEQAMALDQWLRWVPDDPAGLLRRKFMIEHMLKQREAQR